MWRELNEITENKVTLRASESAPSSHDETGSHETAIETTSGHEMVLLQSPANFGTDRTINTNLHIRVYV